MADKCYIKGCRRYKDMQQVMFKGKKVMMCGVHKEAYKHVR